MNEKRLKYFRGLLLGQLQAHAEHISAEQAAVLQVADDGAKESADLSIRDVIEELALKLGERESQLIADIDQALLRIEEGSFGKCVRCGKEIDERRLEALPTARYDANCQAQIEVRNGQSAGPSL